MPKYYKVSQRDPNRLPVDWDDMDGKDAISMNSRLAQGFSDYKWVTQEELREMRNNAGLFSRRRQEIKQFSSQQVDYGPNSGEVERYAHEAEMEYWEETIKKEIEKSLGLVDLKRRLYGA